MYPPGMNKAIATAVSRFLAERQLETSWSELPKDMQELICTEYTEESIVQTRLSSVAWLARPKRWPTQYEQSGQNI